MRAISRQVLWLIFLISGFFAGVCQDMIVANDADFLPPAPSTAVFRQYMGEQPSLATGAVNVTVPIYNIQCHGLDIPLSLRYRSNGVKVFDDPFPCGYGWSLLPGLRVMRTILGRPDELFEFKGDEPNLVDDYTTLQRCMNQQGYLDEGMEDRYDAEHDIFTVCLVDGSYSFIIEKEANGTLKFKGIGCSEIKISADSKLDTIVVTDSKGIRYVFGGACEVTSRFITAWMLKKIELTNGEEISFEWISFNHPFQVGVLNPDKYIDNVPAGVAVVHNGQILTESFLGVRTYLSPFTGFQHLKKISFPGGHVDIDYTLYIKTLKVYSNAGLVKTVSFSHENVGGGSQKCLLRKISLSDEGDYKFNYNPIQFGNIYRQDYWGYYNNRPSNDDVNMSPKMRIKCQGTGYIEMGNADKRIDAVNMQANILTSVEYPTGGSTSFEYEPHRFDDPTIYFDPNIHPDDNPPLTEGGGLRVVKVTNISGEDTPAIIKRYVYGKNEDGKAICTATPMAQTFLSRNTVISMDSKNWSPPEPVEHDIVSLNPISGYMEGNINGIPIWYSQVTEYIESDGTQTGKKVYEFASIEADNDIKIDNYGYKYPLGLNKVFASDIVPVFETIYSYDKSTYTAVSEISRQYKGLNNGQFMNTKIIRHYRSTFENDEAPDFNDQGYIVYKYLVDDPYTPERFMYVYVPTDKAYGAYPYYINLDNHVLASECVTTYSENGDNTVRKIYDYVEDSNIVDELSVIVNGVSISNLQLFYPHTVGTASDQLEQYDSQSPLFNDMVAENILSAPVLTIMNCNSKISMTQNIVKHYGNRLYLPQKTLGKRGGSKASVLGQYSYDPYGNLYGRVKPDGVSEIFLWGYYGRYPIAYISGSVADEAISSEKYHSWPYAGSANPVDLSSVVGEGALVSTYTYSDLIGVSSTTEPVGNKRSFSYDDKLRLSSISVDGRGLNSSMAYETADEKFGISVSADKSTYEFGETVRLECNVEHASSDVTYRWTVRDSDNAVIFVGNTASCSYIRNCSGQITATCIAKDMLKGYERTASVNYNVKPQNVHLSNICSDNTHSSVTAELYCAYPLKATFRIMVSGDHEIYRLIIDGVDYAESIGDSEYFTMDFSAGNHYVELSFTEEATEGEVVVYISSVSGSHSETCSADAMIINRGNRRIANDIDEKKEDEKKETTLNSD